MNKYNNIFLLFLIFIVSIIFFLVLKDNIYAPYSDIGREVYIPTEIIKGKILYKDIFCLYAPLGYLLNALIIKIFGNTLLVFELIGYLLTLLTLTAIFFITENYTNKLSAFSITLLVCATCAFFPSNFNWITPYSYSILYALCAVLWSIFCCIKYIDINKNIFIYLSFFLYGLSICFKYEYFFFLFALLTVIIYKKLCNKREYFKIISILFMTPLITLISLLLMKCSLSDILKSITDTLLLSRTEALKYFYTYSGFIPTLQLYKAYIYSIINPQYYIMFCTFGIISLLTLIISIIKKIEFKIIFINLSTVLLCIKSIFVINLSLYGTFFLPILIVTLYIYLYRLFRNKKYIPTIIAIIVFLIYTNYDFTNINPNEIKTEKGNIRIKQEYYITTNQILNYIKNNTNDNEKVLILPEGTLINYITNRTTDNYLQQLIPTNYELFGNDYVINRLKNSKYDYIVVSNILYNDYGESSFCSSWGEKFCVYLKDNYNKETTLGNDFKLTVYKLK